MPELLPGHCIDTNALIDLWRRVYPPDVFKGLWEKIEGQVEEGFLIAPKEVLSELEQQDDELLRWAKLHRKMFKALDADQQRHVAEILERFPDLVDPNKVTPDADPFVIALAMSQGWKVITSEAPSRGGRPKIPNVCSSFGIGCLSLLEFFREKNWEF